MWRSRLIARRAHPLALATYAVVFLLGLFNIINVFDSHLLDQVVGIAWRYVWQWLLAVGGALGLAGALWRRDLEDALVVERAGAWAGFFGMSTYTGAVIYVAPSSPGWLLIGLLALGLGLRAVQIILERRIVAELAREHPEVRR